jgi:hypothetical protein
VCLLCAPGSRGCRYAKLTHALEDPYRAYNLYTLIVSILCIATLIRCNATYQTRWVRTSLADLGCYPKADSQADGKPVDIKSRH